MKKLILKSDKKIALIILIIVGIILLLVSFFINEYHTINIFRLVGVSLLFGLVIAGLFNKNPGYKPTIEEIEERQFGKNK